MCKCYKYKIDEISNNCSKMIIRNKSTLDDLDVMKILNFTRYM